MLSTAGVVAYVMLWMVVFLAALPVGIRRNRDPELGHDAGAPENPRLWTKVAATTVIAAALWGVAYWVVESGQFSLRPSVLH